MRPRPNSSLYLRHLPETVRPEEVKSIFMKYGQVRDVYIPCDHFTNRPRGFAYVEYPFLRFDNNF
uniref:RRM domain-containing protein n=1 Tax=Romanomermis culicivorax TaxID=13658 RepID=A0A915J7E9_ROMCU